MRFAIPVLPVLLLALSGHALEKNDVVGFWKGSPQEDPGVKFEAYFDANGNCEMRGGGVALGIFPFESTAKGVWKVQANDLWVKINSSWTTVAGQPPEADDPDLDYLASEAVYTPNPKTLKMTDCDEEDDCTTMVLAYVGMDKAFTLRAIAGGVGVRRNATAKADRTRNGWVRFSLLKNGQAFDLRGRATPQNR